MKISKKLLSVLLAVSLTSISIGVYAGTIVDQYKTPRGNTATVEEELVHKNRIGITVNGKKINQDTWYANSNTYAPLRATAEALGATVNYNADTLSADITTNDTAVAPSQITGVWAGTYNASQGDTSLELTFSGETATFEFGPTSSNSSVPKGSFTTLVEYDNQTGLIKLEGVKWINQPSNYSMVNLVGSVSPTGYINGAVTEFGSGDYTFSVKKIK